MRTAQSRRCLLPFAAASLAIAIFASSSAEATDAALIERGKYLAIASDCTACHTAPGGAFMAGGLPIATPIGAIVATNITPSKTHGIGNYTLAQFDAALRRGIRADGEHLYPAMPYTSYALLSDDDVAALYAYFTTEVAPVESSPPPTSLPFPFNVRLSMAAWNLLFLKHGPYVPDPAENDEWNRGAYLVNGPAHCVTCHTPRNLLMAEDGSRALAGASLGGWFAPNITSDANSGAGGWSDDELVAYLRDGHAQGKSQAAGPMAEAIDNSLRFLSAEDLHAIAVYLKTVPPVRDAGDSKPVFSWGSPSDELASIRGTAWPSDPDSMTGAQLYDAWCATCHQADGQGSFDGTLPSLLHNTALGRANTDNLVMVMLRGLRRGEVLMPGFADAMSDTQMATLGTYLMDHFGNPAGTVTAAQIKKLRAGPAGSSLVVFAQAGVGVAALVLIAIVLLLIRRWRRTPAAQPAGRQAS
jgi:mono/diheme cytochrome c family protein